MRPTPGKSLAIVLLVALALRFAAGGWWQSWLDRQGRGPFGFGDSDGYWELGRAIARSEPYQYGPEGFRVFRAPGYPILLAPLCLLEREKGTGTSETRSQSPFATPPPVMWFRALSAILDTAAVAAVAWLAWRLFSPWAGVLAGGMAALYPGSIAVGVLVLSEAPFCPLMLLHLGLWMAAWTVQSPRKATGLALAAGLAAGAAALMRPDWLLFIPFAMIVGVVFGRPAREKGTGTSRAPSVGWSRSQSPFPVRHLGLGLVMLAGLAVAMTPWWVRNARVTGHLVPTTLQVGASLYDGWNPAADGSSEWTWVEGKAKDLASEIVHGDPTAAVSGDWEYQLDAALRREAMDWAWHNPGRVAELAAVKFARMWNLWPNEPGMSAWPIRWGLAATYVPILVLGLWGAVRTLRRGWLYVLCWLPAVYFTLLHMVFVSSIRYRQPAMLGLIVLAAGIVSHWETRGPGRRERRGVTEDTEKG